MFVSAIATVDDGNCTDVVSDKLSLIMSEEPPTWFGIDSDDAFHSAKTDEFWFPTAGVD